MRRLGGGDSLAAKKIEPERRKTKAEWPSREVANREEVERETATALQ
jgi:hypothetical protein